MCVEMNDEYLDQSEIRYLGDVQRLQLEPGDVVVLTANHVLRPEVLNAIQGYMDKRLHGHTVLVLDSTLRIGVLGKQGKADGSH